GVDQLEGDDAADMDREMQPVRDWRLDDALGGRTFRQRVQVEGAQPRPPRGEIFSSGDESPEVLWAGVERPASIEAERSVSPHAPVKPVKSGCLFSLNAATASRLAGPPLRRPNAAFSRTRAARTCSWRAASRSRFVSIRDSMG